MSKQVRKRKVTLKDGFYFEVQSKYGNESAIKIRRDTKAEIDAALKMYSKTKSVNYLGEVKNGKFV